ncbi:thiamine pyrophosphate-dependent enzyme, partial [Acetomicrobium sp. S15 = DSM 107314]|uniref:thiamine pyrophosphate-dependent enzyme n=1 Tax=Acetomicrobium sp. S15 = DSM 107314 TaxID=2529858 RepID=UPI00406BF20A
MFSLGILHEASVSFAFTVGELETLVRFGANVKIFLYKNDAYGWIRGESVWAEKMEPFA